MCRGLNPDFRTWPAQSGQAVGREVGQEERTEGNPGNCFEPSRQSPYSLFCTEEQLSRRCWQQHPCLSSLSPLSVVLQGPRQPWDRACLRLGSFALSKCSDDTGWGGFAHDSWNVTFTIHQVLLQIDFFFFSENLSWHCFFLLLFCFGLLFPFGNVPSRSVLSSWLTVAFSVFCMVQDFIQYFVSSAGFHPDVLQHFMEGELPTLHTLAFMHGPEASLWRLKIEKWEQKTSLETTSPINKSRHTFFKTACGFFWRKNLNRCVCLFGLHGVL